MSSLNFIILVVTLLNGFYNSVSIVNPDRETANTVIRMRSSYESAPRAWTAGVQCIDKFNNIYFSKREKLTRSANLVLTSAFGMSTPAAQIQEKYLKLINEAVSERRLKRKIFQLRVISDMEMEVPSKVEQRELFLADFYVIVVDSADRLKNLMRNHVSQVSSWNPGARFLVLYHNATSWNEEEQVAMEIFNEMLGELYVHFVGLLYATDLTKYSFLVMDYYNPVACRTMRLRRIGECDDGNPLPSYQRVLTSLRNYFNKISLANCTFYMCASIAQPFIEEDCQTGIELRLVTFMKNRLGFNINQTCETESRGVLEYSGHWTGLLGKLNDRYCDFILGGFYPDNDVVDSFWTSECYLSDSHTWHVKLADPRPAWKALYSIFENETWLCFIVLLFISWFFWYFFVNMLPEPAASKELTLAGLNSMGVAICAAVNERPICNASRIFFFVLSVYGLNVAATYTSKLIAVFSNPGHTKQIKSLEDVIEAGIPFGGFEESRDWFENDDDMWIFEHYNSSSIFEPNHPNNLEAVKNGERAILSSRTYILQSNISDEIYAFRRNVFSSPLQIIMKPGFPFMYSFNWLIRYMCDMGIFDKIDNDFRYNNTYLNRIAKMRPEFKESAIVLTTDHMQGPFAVLIVGLISSVLLFLCELLVHCLFANKRNKSRKELRKLKRKRELAAKPKERDARKKKLKERIVEQKIRDHKLKYPVDVVQTIRLTPAIQKIYKIK